MPKANSLSDIGAKTEELSAQEEQALRRSLERSLEDTRSEGQYVLRQNLREYYDEIKVAASIARHELNGSFDGQVPESGNFGVDTIHPGYFGYNSWEEATTVTGSGEFDWIDNGTPDNLAGGGSGFSAPVRIGSSAVHIILGFGTFADAPKVNRLKEEQNDSPLPAVTTQDVFKNTDIKVKWKDTPTILQPDDTYAVRGFLNGPTGTDHPVSAYPIGLTFLQANKYRLLNPADMAGTSDSDIVIQ